MSVEVLEETLNKVFTSMTDGKAKTFSDGIANAVVAFVSSGIVQTIDGGTVTGELLQEAVQVLLLLLLLNVQVSLKVPVQQ